VQSTSDLDHLHARPLPYSRVKSRDDPIAAVEEIAEFCIRLYIKILDLSKAISRKRCKIGGKY